PEQHGGDERRGGRGRDALDVIAIAIVGRGIGAHERRREQQRERERAHHSSSGLPPTNSTSSVASAPSSSSSSTIWPRSCLSRLGCLNCTSPGSTSSTLPTLWQMIMPTLQA